MKARPYVYKLTHRETGKFYFGYRYTNKVPAIDDLGVYYFSSSSEVSDLGFSNFDLVIVAEFSTAEDAYRFENTLIEEHFQNPLCLNRRYYRDHTPYFNPQNSTTRSKISEYQSNRTDEHRRKLGLAHKNKIISPEMRAKQSSSLSGTKNPRSKTWKIQKDDGEIFQVVALKEWCRNNDIKYISLYMTQFRGNFYRGLRVVIPS